MALMCAEIRETLKNRQKIGIRDRLRFKEKENPKHQEKNLLKTLDTENKAGYKNQFLINGFFQCCDCIDKHQQ